MARLERWQRHLYRAAGTHFGIHGFAETANRHSDETLRMAGELYSQDRSNSFDELCAAVEVAAQG